MSLWRIAWKSIQHRALASSLTAFSMSLGVALVVTVLVINGVIKQTFQQGAQGYDLIVGAKGGKLQLVFSTVFYNQDTLSLIPYHYYELMKTSRYSAEIDAAIPIARGDNYQGFPVVGTTPEYFKKLLTSAGKHYTLSSGEFFKNAQRNGAVVGYTVAKKMGLRVGDKVRFGHTNIDGDLHEPFEVTGVLHHTGSPNDRAVFVNLEGFFDQHKEQTGAFAVDYSLVEKEKAAKLAAMGKAPEGAATVAKTDEKDHADHKDADHKDADHKETDHKDADHKEAAAHDDHAGHDEHGHEGHNHGAEKRLTAILLVTKEAGQAVAGTAEDINKLSTVQPGVEVAESDLVTTKKKKVYSAAVTALPAKIEGELLEAQAVAPVQIIAEFFQDVIGNIQKILIIFAVQVIIVAGIGMMVSIYNSMNERRQEIAIMRALGARRRTVMSIILLESILLSLGGGLLGLLIGHGLVAVINPWIMEYSNVMVRPWDFQLTELILIPGLILLASIVGYLPAVIAYRTDVAQSLQP